MKKKFTKSTGNVFKDAGILDAKSVDMEMRSVMIKSVDMEMRSIMIMELLKIIKKNGLTRTSGAVVFGCYPHEISALFSGRAIKCMSFKRLSKMLNNAGYKLTIKLKKK